MKLPTIDTPIYEVKLFSREEPVKFRPFLVKEQKLMLMVMEERNPEEATKITKQIIKSCLQDQTIDVDSLPAVDIEILFLNFRARSMGENIDVYFKCKNMFKFDEEEEKSLTDRAVEKVKGLGQTVRTFFKPASEAQVSKVKALSFQMVPVPLDKLSQAPQMDPVVFDQIVLAAGRALWILAELGYTVEPDPAKLWRAVAELARDARYEWSGDRKPMIIQALRDLQDVIPETIAKLEGEKVES